MERRGKGDGIGLDVDYERLAAATDPLQWSVTQQKALEAALVKYPSAMDKNARWKAIAAGDVQ